MTLRKRIAAVSYLNTVPFIYGIEHADEALRAALLLFPPSGCAAAFSSGEADIALIPTGALTVLKGTRIATPFCIGAHGSVRTVALMSDYPLAEIRRIHLDSHSITSALLLRILCAQVWSITPEFVRMDDYSVADTPATGDAFLLIGDKVFGLEGRFVNTWDLAEMWQCETGLPFVFAVWVARGELPPRFDDALDYGVRHIREAIVHYGHADKDYAYDYLTRNIDYRFDERKRRALQLFLDEGRKFAPRSESGPTK
ncbi:MAG: menaquinone biosynthesis protein [Rikenellaceae bacterium]|nr:menaquinone biosynthesis protein [Rikenellaceae bacterium]MCL2692995.1 menaquinone biosynthesis protein [Rikenellaceae bacterium]